MTRDKTETLNEIQAICNGYLFSMPHLPRSIPDRILAKIERLCRDALKEQRNRNPDVVEVKENGE